MSFNVSALANYTTENQDQLVSAAVLGAKTATLIKNQGNVMVGVKSAEKINIMDTDAVFQAGGTCGFNNSGTTTFTQRTVTIGKIKVNESLCIKSLETKYIYLHSDITKIQSGLENIVTKLFVESRVQAHDENLDSYLESVIGGYMVLLEELTNLIAQTQDIACCHLELKT